MLENSHNEWPVNSPQFNALWVAVQVQEEEVYTNLNEVVVKHMSAAFWTKKHLAAKRWKVYALLEQPHLVLTARVLCC